MLDNRIVIILPNGALVKMVEAVLAHMDLAFPVYEMQTEAALKMARVKVEQGAQVIISRGMTAAYLRERLNIPVLEIKYDFFHFATAMRKALCISPEISVIGFIEQYKLAERARGYVRRPGQQIHVHILPNADRVEGTIHAMAKQNVQVFVGGLLVVKTAENMGYRGILVGADEKAVQTAIHEALYELHIDLERSERYSLINTILNSASNGVFAVDADGMVTVSNPIAQAVLNRFEAGWKDMPIQRIMSSLALANALQTGRKLNDELVPLGRSIIAVSASPILMDGRFRGAVVTIQDADKIQTLDFKIRKKRMDKGHLAKTSIDDIIGVSDVIQSCKEMARSYANADSTVLILGETGTGKEMFAQSIHNLSRRAQHPFVAVNCAALTPGLLESELFGYVKGAFTGANNEGKTGIFELAHTGTIFLDEIGELPLEVQSRLLRVIQEKQLTRIGDDNVIPVDVRILTATNRNLEDEVAQGRFREDLFYRLSVLELRLPPLRERREDIPVLISHYVDQKCLAAGAAPIPVPDEIMHRFQQLPLRGNIRELINLVERALVIGKYKTLAGESLAFPGKREIPLGHISAATPESSKLLTLPPGGKMADLERAAILSAIKQCGNNKAAAARLLGISKSTLWRRLK